MRGEKSPKLSAVPIGKADHPTSQSSRLTLTPAPLSSKPSLTTLPPKIILQIFESLCGPISSTCLGLTCKAFYKIHKAILPEPVNLRRSDRNVQGANVREGNVREVKIQGRYVNKPLYKLLESWMPPGMLFNRRYWTDAKFVKIANYKSSVSCSPWREGVSYVDSEGKTWWLEV